jgi:ADP-ribosyl-[dinitrogen reductase] hydrolase
VAWYRTGAYSVNGRCFDIGGTTSGALHAYERTGDAATSGDIHEHSAGNGSIMRLAPVPISYARLYPDQASTLIRYAVESSLPTHRTPQATSACGLMALMLAALIAGEARDTVLDPDWPQLGVLREVVDVHPEIEEIIAGSYRSDPPVIRGSGYVVRSLEAALWAFARAEGFEDAVLAAVNLGDDADTTGAVCGQFAGAHWGISGIPQPLLDGLAQRDMIEAAARHLVETGEA